MLKAIMIVVLILLWIKGFALGLMWISAADDLIILGGAVVLTIAVYVAIRATIAAVKAVVAKVSESNFLKRKNNTV